MSSSSLAAQTRGDKHPEATFASAVSNLVTTYRANTHNKLKILDIFIVFCVLLAGTQLFYCLAVGTFPFNSFLSGFFGAVGAAILTVSLRLHVAAELCSLQSPASASAEADSDDNLSLDKLAGTTLQPAEKAFRDYVVGMVILFVCMWNFMG